MPWEWWRWHLARETGWTLEYVDGLSMADWFEYWQIADGEGRAHKAAGEAARAKQSRRGR